MQGNPGSLWEHWGHMPLHQRLNIFKGIRNFWHFAKGAKMLRWCLEDKAQHLHALNPHAAATAAWVAAGALGIPFSFSIHTRQLKELPMLASKARDAAFVRCDTEETKDILLNACRQLDNAFPQENILVLRDGLTLPPPSSEDAMPEAANSPLQGKVRILVAGHMTPHKGLHALLRACVLLKKQNIPIHLTVAGSAPNFMVLRLRALMMGLHKQMSFTGLIPHEHMPELLRKTQIFVAPGITLRNG